jgi:hypothetical protein
MKLYLQKGKSHPRQPRIGSQCVMCHQFFFSEDEMKTHYRQTHEEQFEAATRAGYHTVSNAFGRTCATYCNRFKPPDSYESDIDRVMRRERDAIRHLLLSRLQQYKSLKYSLILKVKLEKHDASGSGDININKNYEQDINHEGLNIVHGQMIMRSRYRELHTGQSAEDFWQQYENTTTDFADRLEKLTSEEGSGWTVSGFPEMEISIARGLDISNLSGSAQEINSSTIRQIVSGNVNAENTVDYT